MRACGGTRHHERAVLTRFLLLLGGMSFHVAVEAADQPRGDRGPASHGARSRLRAIVGRSGAWVAAYALSSTLAGVVVAQPSGPNGNLPLPPDTLRQRLQDDDFEIADVKGAGGGVMGAKKLRLVFNDGFTTEVKWKEAPSGGDAWNNTPRREVAAYVVQRLFLDPDDYVVPPAVARCIPFEDYRGIGPTPTPNLLHGRCVFGSVAAWLQNVHVPDETFQQDRFKRDPRYAHRAANLNLLTFLIAHRDAKASNFLISNDPNNPQLFSVDNGISFSGAYNIFVEHFDHFEVGGVPRQAVDRLRKVTADDLSALGVLGEMRVDANLVLRSVMPSATADPDKGVRNLDDGIQFGLTAEEIAGVAARLQGLLERIDRGELVVF
jgi:hypothetical protein